MRWHLSRHMPAPRHGSRYKRDAGRSRGSRINATSPIFSSPCGLSDPLPTRMEENGRVSDSPLTVAGAAADLLPDDCPAGAHDAPYLTRSRGTDDTNPYASFAPSGKQDMRGFPRKCEGNLSTKSVAHRDLVRYEASTKGARYSTLLLPSGRGAGPSPPARGGQRLIVP
jgi:hypothetical protein